MKSSLLVHVAALGSQPAGVGTGWCGCASTTRRRCRPKAAAGSAATLPKRPSLCIGRWRWRGGVALAPSLLLNLGASAGDEAGQASCSPHHLRRACWPQRCPPSWQAPRGSSWRDCLQRSTGSFRKLLGCCVRPCGLDPGNAAARYNYELLSQYLAGQRPPALPTPERYGGQPPPCCPSQSKTHTAQPGAGSQRRPPLRKAGNDEPGEVPDPVSAPPVGGTSGAPTPSADGQARPPAPYPRMGGSANGWRRPGRGERSYTRRRACPAGRGLPLGASASEKGFGPPGGQAPPPGTRKLLPTPTSSSQTQRERLRGRWTLRLPSQQVP